MERGVPGPVADVAGAEGRARRGDDHAAQEALKGGNTIAAYLRCKHCKERGVKHQLVGVTEVAISESDHDTRTQHMVCTACAGVDHILLPLLSCPFEAG
eukprot:3073279-Rhodomonas_salina.1